MYIHFGKKTWTFIFYFLISTVKPGTPHSPTPPALTGNQLKLHGSDFPDVFKQMPAVPTSHMDSLPTTPSPARELGSVTPHSELDTHPLSGAITSMATSNSVINRPQVLLSASAANPQLTSAMTSQGHHPPGFSEGFVRPQRPSALEDPFGRPPMTPHSSGIRAGMEDPYSTRPPAPRMPMENFARPPPPTLADPYAHPPHTPRTPQEQHFEPRFPTPAPRMAVPFSSRGPHQQPASRPPLEAYTRPTLAPQRGHPQPVSAAATATRDQFSQQQRSISADPYAFQPGTPHPSLADPYAQPPPTPQVSTGVQ